MRATLELGSGAEPTDLFAFEHWLKSTAEVAAEADIRIEDGGSEEHLGAGEVIAVIAASVSALTSIVNAYGAWRASRAATPPLIIVIDGQRKLEIREGSATELEALRPRELGSDRDALPAKRGDSDDNDPDTDDAADDPEADDRDSGDGRER